MDRGASWAIVHRVATSQTQLTCMLWVMLCMSKHFVFFRKKKIFIISTGTSLDDNFFNDELIILISFTY